jgi:hypothetical protein
MWRTFLILILIGNSIYPVYAFDSCNIEKELTSFFTTLSKCDKKVEVAVRNIVTVSDTGNDYSQMKPVIFPEDIQVTVKVKLCDINDQYFVWLRESKSSYKVITYTSFSQPE